MTQENNNNKKAMVCKLTTPELQQRKAGIIANLKARITQRKELGDGFAYLFAATDDTIDEVSAFIKTERICCDFFSFSMSVAGNELWLTLTGEEGVKAFIAHEIGL